VMPRFNILLTVGHKVGHELCGERVDLVTGAHEDEGGEEDVEHGIVGHQHQHTVRISTQPNVVLKLKGQCHNM
jgi:hypothetical protein